MRSTVSRAIGVLLVVTLSAGLFLGLAPLPLRAQQAQTVSPGTEVNRFNGRYVGKIFVDFTKVFVSPGHWRGKDLVLFGAAAGTTGLLFVVDSRMRSWFEKHAEPSSNSFSTYASKLGEGPFLLSLMATLYIGGEVFREDSLRKTALMSLESFAISGAIVGGLKFFFGRHRPWAKRGAFDFHFFTFANHEHSFPSGHSVAAFSVAAVIAGESDSLVVGILSYGLASLVAASRVNNNEHWISDVFVGSALGYFVGKKVLALNRPKRPDQPTLSLAPAPGGLSLSLRF